MRIHTMATLVCALWMLTQAQCKKAETHELEPGNTETGDQIDPDEVVSVGIRPSVVQIDLYTPIDLKAHARTRDGGWYDTVGGTWHSTNDDRATVDENGHLIPRNLGPVLIEYEWEGIAAEPATIEIVAPGKMDVTVVDVRNGEPAAGVNVGLSYGHEFVVQGVTDGTGQVRLEGSFQGPVSLFAWKEEGFRGAAIAQVAPRQVYLPIYPAGEAYGVGTMKGVVNFDDSDMGEGNIGVALAVPSIDDNPIALEAKQLLGRDQDLSGYGLNWTVPENVQISGIMDNFHGDVEPGRRVIFAAGGVYDLGIALELALNLDTYGTGAIFPTMTNHIENLRVGFSQPYDFEPDGAISGIQIDLMTELPIETWLDLAPPPPGGYWPDPILVLSFREFSNYGFVGVGFGTGDHPYMPDADPPEDDDDDDDDATWAAARGGLEERIWMPVREAARDGIFEDVPSRHLAFLWEGGVDYGGRATGVVSSPTTRDKLVLPDFLELIETTTPAADSWHIQWASPEGTDLTRVYARPDCALDDMDRWYVFGPGMDEFRFATDAPRIHVYGPETTCDPIRGWGTVFSPHAFSLELVSYQSLINIHDEPVWEYWEYVNRRTYDEIYADGVNFP